MQVLVLNLKIPIPKILLNVYHPQRLSFLAEYSLILTFDDGHKGNFHLFNICKKYKVNPTIYVCTKIVNSSKGFWFNFVNDKEKDYLKKLTQSKRLEILKNKYHFFQKKESFLTFIMPTADLCGTILTNSSISSIGSR